MIAVIATLYIKPGMAEEFVAAFAVRRARVLATEPDVLQYELYQAPQQPLEFVVIERFTSRARRSWKRSPAAPARWSAPPEARSTHSQLLHRSENRCATATSADV
jgi:quinol monooxygenase YgiN